LTKRKMLGRTDGRGSKRESSRKFFREGRGIKGKPRGGEKHVVGGERGKPGMENPI